MKDLIKNVEFKMLVKQLAVSGSIKNLHLKVKGNVLTIGEIVFVDNNKNSHLDLSCSKEDGGDVTVSGNHDYKLVVKYITVSGGNGELFSAETMELNSIVGGMELFTAITK